ncbi:unnamed protein product [Allacma fusca]|uniref:Uncharacterized protein n=1 Tax=Allacma fusca TaxID=39272 RepID=A0A8J2P1J1_9HEXA|nr:unnamed protein product [Allacma fusca]
MRLLSFSISMVFLIALFIDGNEGYFQYVEHPYWGGKYNPKKDPRTSVFVCRKSKKRCLNDWQCCSFRCFYNLRCK